MRHAMEQLDLRTTDASLGVRIFAEQLEHLRPAQLDALATLSKPTERKAIREIIRSKAKK